MSATKRLYFDDAYLTDFEAAVTARISVEGRPAVVLDETAFYPESGGQPWDLGTIDGVEVLKVVEDGEAIVHVLAREVAGPRVRGAIDWGRRFDHMQQHTGQHVLSQAFLETARGETRSFHLGPDVSTLEIGLPAISDETLDRVEGRANAALFADLEVRTSFVPSERITEVPLRRPPKVSGLVRVVEVDGFDWSACGGTHCRRTGEIGLIKVLGWEKIRGNLRFTFVCGGRALGAYQVRARVVRDLAGRFNVQPVDVPASVARLADEAKELKRQIKRAEERLAGYEAEELLARSGDRIVAAVLEDRAPEAARALALAVARRGGAFACFGARSEARSHLLLARSDDVDVDLRPFVPEIAPLIQGKGGGGPSLVEIAGDPGADLAAAVTRGVALFRAAAHS